MKSDKIEKLENEMLEAVDGCLSVTLDSVELVVGNDKEWAFLRSRLLRCFGDRGLRGKVVGIIKKYEEGESQYGVRPE